MEIRLEDQNGTTFGLSRMMKRDNLRWAYIEVLFQDLKKMVQNDAYPSDDRIDPARISKFAFIIHNNSDNGIIPRQGSIVFDQIRGVMRTPKGSPWEQAEEKQRETLSLHLATQAENLEDRSGALMLRALLASEALRLYHCWETDQALRSAIELMPRKIAMIQINVSHYGGYLPKESFLSGLNRVTGKRLSSILRPSLKVVALSSDGSRLAAANGDILKVWDIKSSKQIKEIMEGGHIDDLAFSSNGTKLAVLSGYNKTKIYDFKKNRNVSLPLESFAKSIAISEDGLRVAILYTNGRIQTWDTGSGSRLADIPQIKVYYDDMPSFSFAFSPDGNLLATGTYSDDALKLWDSASGEERWTLPYRGRLFSIAFSPDGSRIAIAGGDEKIRVWAMADSAKLLERPVDGYVIDMAFSPDGTRLATAGSDNMARVWDIGSGQELVRMEHEGPIRCVRFAEDGKRIVTASDDNTAQLWEMTSSQELISFESESQARAMSFSSNGSLLSAISYEEAPSEIFIVDANSGRPMSMKEFLALGKPMGAGVITGPSDLGNYNKTAQLWDLKSGALISSKSFDSDYFSLENTSLSYRNPNGLFTNLEVWNLLSGNCSSTLTLSEDDTTFLRCGAFSANGSRLVTAGDNGSIGFLQIWNISSEKELERIPYTGKIGSIAITPDCSRLIAAGYNTIQVWDLLLHKRLVTTGYEGTPKSVAISPDGSKIAIANYNGTAWVLDALSGQLLARFELQEPINSVAFSSDGLCLATGGDDKTVRIWDIEHKDELVRLKHSSPVLAAVFSPDGSRLAAACEDKTIKVWIWRYEDLLSEACSRLARNLTQEEWLQYLGDEPYRETCPCKECKTVYGSLVM